MASSGQLDNMFVIGAGKIKNAYLTYSLSSLTVRRAEALRLILFGWQVLRWKREWSNLVLFKSKLLYSTVLGVKQPPFTILATFLVISLE